MGYSLRCPNCGSFLGEVEAGARLICQKCKGQTTFTPRERRTITVPTPARPGPEYRHPVA